MNKLFTGMMVVVGVLLLGAAVSGFVSDAELSSVRLGSDFSDSRFQQFDGLSIERAEQRTRREQIGLEAVGGAGLILGGLVLFVPRKRELTPLRKRVVEEAKQAAETRVAGAPFVDANVSRRRRPDSSVYLRQG